MTFIYKILGFFINIVAFFFALSLLFIVPVAIGLPALWFPVFLIVAVILYSWFSLKFQQRVLKKHEVVRHSVRDMIRVNGIASLMFVFIDISSIIVLLRHPQSYIDASKEMIKQLGPDYQQSFKAENVNILGIAGLIYLIALLFHILWTFALLKKHKDFFD